MNAGKRFIFGLLSSIVLAPTCWAQAPAIPTTPAAPANLWSLLLPNADQKAACKNCLCNSPLGALTSSAAGSLSALSGGLMPNRCAQNSIANAIAQQDATSSEGASARIKKDEADAKARRDAVRYLGTVDCHYWPEATEALVNSLRKDRNECVRFEAALALRNGCCCNDKTVKALEMCVKGSDKDGSPAERSDRVRAAAADALARCPLLKKEGDKNKELKKTEVVDPTDAYYYARVAKMPREEVVASARIVLVSLQQANQAAGARVPVIAPIARRPSGMTAILANAFSPTAGCGSVAAGQPRQPFFSNLTRQLTGRQDSAVPVQFDYMPPVRAERRPPTSSVGTLGYVEIVPAP